MSSDRSWRRRYEDEAGQLRLDKLVQATPMPVYGLAGHPSSLTIHTVSLTTMSETVHSVGFAFQYPEAGQARRSFYIESMRPTSQGAPHSDWLHIPVENPLCDEDGKPFEHYGTVDAARNARPAHGHLLIDRLTVADRDFAAKIQRWSRPESEWKFILIGQESIVSGGAQELLQDDLFDLFAQLVVVNGRADLLARYQNELESTLRQARLDT